MSLCLMCRRKLKLVQWNCAQEATVRACAEVKNYSHSTQPHTDVLFNEIVTKGGNLQCEVQANRFSHFVRQHSVTAAYTTQNVPVHYIVHMAIKSNSIRSGCCYR